MPATDFASEQGTPQAVALGGGGGETGGSPMTRGRGSSAVFLGRYYGWPTMA